MGDDDRNAMKPRASALLIAEGFDGPHAGAEALGAMGVAISGPFGMAEAPALIVDSMDIELILIEAAGAGPEALEATLTAADAADAAGGPAIIVTLAEEQIDEVAARLLTGRVQLLCAPGHSDRIAAIAMALAGRGQPVVREDDREAEKLRRLNAEVARIAETLARLTGTAREPGGRDGVADRLTRYRGPDEGEPVIVAASEVRQAIRIRRLRDQFFANSLFEDPAWDMLLDLFAAELERARVSVSSLCIAAAVAPTTALRWIGRMTEAGLFEREPDPFDRRRAYMVLSAKAREGMQGYCTAVKRIGGTIA